MKFTYLALLGVTTGLHIQQKTAETAKPEALAQTEVEVEAEAEAEQWFGERVDSENVKYVNNGKFFKGKFHVDQRLGCFNDKEDRALDQRLDTDGNMKIKECILLGKELGLPYVGVQYGGECWGGTNFDKWGKTSEDKCDMKCNNDRGRYRCGGAWAQHVYRTYKPDLKGCYIDSANRTLPVKLNPEKVTWRDCVNEAAQQGLPYAGVQYGGECWGGSEYPKYGEGKEGDCDMPCAGDENQKCGGHWRQLVYRTGVDDFCDCSCHGDQYSFDSRGHSDPDCWMPQMGYDKECCNTVEHVETSLELKYLDMTIPLARAQAHQ